MRTNKIARIAVELLLAAMITTLCVGCHSADRSASAPVSTPDTSAEISTPPAEASAADEKTAIYNSLIRSEGIRYPSGLIKITVASDQVNTELICGQKVFEYRSGSNLIGLYESDSKTVLHTISVSGDDVSETWEYADGHYLIDTQDMADTAGMSALPELDGKHIKSVEFVKTDRSSTEAGVRSLDYVRVICEADAEDIREYSESDTTGEGSETEQTSKDVVYELVFDSDTRELVEIRTDDEVGTIVNDTYVLEKTSIKIEFPDEYEPEIPDEGEMTLISSEELTEHFGIQFFSILFSS